jgi:hypothetical protein
MMLYIPAPLILPVSAHHYTMEPSLPGDLDYRTLQRVKVVEMIAWLMPPEFADYKVDIGMLGHALNYHASPLLPAQWLDVLGPGYEVIGEVSFWGPVVWRNDLAEFERTFQAITNWMWRMHQ